MPVTKDPAALARAPFDSGPALTPGAYEVYAFDTVDDLEYANSEAMRSFSSQTVTLGANQTTQLKVKLTHRKGN
jgi:hypothetical protein